PPCNHPPKHVRLTQREWCVASTNAENLHLIEAEIVSRDGIHQPDHDRIVSPYTTVNKYSATLLMLKPFEIGRRSRRRSRNLPHWGHVVIPEVFMMIGLEDCNLSLWHHEG